MRRSPAVEQNALRAPRCGSRACRPSLDSAAPRPGRRGYTLLELVVSSGTASLLMIGLASAIFIAARTVDPPAAVVEVLDASRVMADLTDELRYATFVLERTGTAVTFAVADRTGDGQPDVIRYAWSGSPGDPLTRSLNRGPASAVLDDVNEFQLSYTIRAKTEQLPTTIESPEQVLKSWNGSTSLSDQQIKWDEWRGEYFKPSLPADALSWKVSRVEFKARAKGSAAGVTYVQLRPAGGDRKPISTVLEQAVMNEGLLNALYSWRQFPFARVTGLSPQQGLCLVLQHRSDNESCEVQYQSGGVALPDAGFLQTSSQGANWEVSTDKSLQFAVHGTYTTPGPPQAVTRNYVTGIRAAVRVGGNANSRVDAGTALLNSPEILSACWEMDFDRDPTAVDAGFDGAADWARRDGQPFNPAALVDGVWRADVTLDSRPENDFSRTTTAEVRFRSTTPGGNGAVFSMNADWTGGTHAPLSAYLQLQPDGTQTLTVYGKRDSSTPTQLVTAPGLPGDFVTLRLVLRPDLDLVNVKLNGVELGSYTYPTFPPANNDRFASLSYDGSSAEFDYVSIRVGEGN